MPQHDDTTHTAKGTTIPGWIKQAMWKPCDDAVRWADYHHLTTMAEAWGALCEHGIRSRQQTPLHYLGWLLPYVTSPSQRLRAFSTMLEAVKCGDKESLMHKIKNCPDLDGVTYWLGLTDDDSIMDVVGGNTIYNKFAAIDDTNYIKRDNAVEMNKADANTITTAGDLNLTLKALAATVYAVSCSAPLGLISQVVFTTRHLAFTRANAKIYSQANIDECGRCTRDTCADTLKRYNPFLEPTDATKP